MVRSRLARAIDRWIDRGPGLGADRDPFGAPLSPGETARLLDAIRSARFAEAAPPFASPIPLADTSARVPTLLRAPARGAAWCVLALPYGGFYRAGALGLYEVQARAMAARGFGVAVVEAPYHGARRLPEGTRSGWGFVRADLGHTMRACAAYAGEVAALARHLREREGADRVVGLGMSLGGNALGLAAALGAPVEKLSFLAAVDNPASFYGTGANREARRRTLTAAGMSLVDVERAFAPISPSSYPYPLPLPRSASSPALFAIPRHDLVVPASTQDAWRVAWSGELLDLRWDAHGVALSSPLAARAIARWLGGR